MTNPIRAVFLVCFMAAASFATAMDHPAYLHALQDLRAARWMIDHRPGNWKTTEDEIAAVRQIDAAIGELKKAAIDDGKNINDHVAIDERPDRAGRLHEAVDLLKKARSDMAEEEDNGWAKGLRNRAWGHIDEALKFADRAIRA